VVELAAMTGDRTKDEQKALVAVAHRIDQDRNRISTSNPRARYVCECQGSWDICDPPELPPSVPLDSRHARWLISVENPDRHPKDCVCHRANVVPADGPSMLEALVVETWEPEWVC